MDTPRWEGPLAKQYPFVLDPFQTAAIACIERRESVLVAAHTSGERGPVAGLPLELGTERHLRCCCACAACSCYPAFRCA